VERRRRRRQRKRLGGEKNEGWSVGNDGERRWPFYSGRGRARRALKGETVGGGGGIKGVRLNTVNHDYGPRKGRMAGGVEPLGIAALLTVTPQNSKFWNVTKNH
jgi:hypothetical protein